MMVCRKWLVAWVLGLVTLAAFASPTAPQSGVEYLTLSNPQPTDTGNKVEVIEFFGYFCSVCNVFEPAFKEWKNQQGPNVVFKRVHVGFGAASVPQQKLFYTLDAMSRLEELHPKIFYAIHTEHQSLRNDEQIYEFIEKNGVNRAQFKEIYTSSAIESYTQAATQLQAIFKIGSVPTLVIDGRYVTSPAMVDKGSPNLSRAALLSATQQVLNALVAKAKQEKTSRSIISIER